MSQPKETNLSLISSKLKSARTTLNMTQAELAEKYDQALDQLAAYRADPFVPSLAKGTTLHQIVYQFKGTELVCAKQIAEEQM